MIATADATDSSTVEQLIQTVSSLQEIVERQAERIDELEDELADYRNHNERDKAEIRQKVEHVRKIVEEPTAEDALSRNNDEKAGAQNAETPLERICSLPEHITDRELTANQERARFIAKDIRDYAEKAPARLVIDSRSIKKVIAASEGKRPHIQTVARVMEFLDDLGKEDVQLKKRCGRKFVVIDPEAADRLANYNRCDPMEGGSHLDGVIQSG